MKVMKRPTLGVKLDFILAHSNNNDRPYQEVKIFDLAVLGLSDSGCSRTILGSQGWKVLKSYCQLNPKIRLNCTVANGQTCTSIGVVEIPYQLRDKVVTLQTLVVPNLPHRLILGIDFWMRMGIIPDLYSGEWKFRSADPVATKINAIHSLDSLKPDQRFLPQVISEMFSSMDKKIGCTSLVELVIRTESTPIKQRYYPLSPAHQKEVNKELEEMLANDIVEPSESLWSSPIVMIKKKTGGWRFCVEYRALNKVTDPDATPYSTSVLR